MTGASKVSFEKKKSHFIAANLQLQRQLDLSEKERQKLLDENFKMTDSFHQTVSTKFHLKLKSLANSSIPI